MWATGISSCTSAGLAGIRHNLLNVITDRPLASNDFNDDNLPDIVWHNQTTGETQMWFMSVSSRIGRATVVDEWGHPIPILLPGAESGAAFRFAKSTISSGTPGDRRDADWCLNGSMKKGDTSHLRERSVMRVGTAVAHSSVQ